MRARVRLAAAWGTTPDRIRNLQQLEVLAMFEHLALAANNREE